MLNKYGPLESFPPDALSDRRELALLFKQLATLRTDAPLFDSVAALEWRGPTPDFAAFAERIGDSRIVARAEKARATLAR
jgi:hypothetical protein